MSKVSKLILLENPTKLFWISLFVNLSAISSLLTLFYIERGLSLIEIAILGVIISWVIILLEIPTGMLADSIGRKKTVILGILSLLIYGTIFLFSYNFMSFIFGVIFFALSISLFSGCMISFIYDSLLEAGKENESKKYIGKYRSASLIGAIFIAPIASIIARDLTNTQFSILLIVNLIGYFIALLIAFTLKEPSITKNKKSKKELIKNGFLVIIKNPILRKLTFNHGIGFVCILVFTQIIAQPFLKQENVPIFLFGTLFSIISILLFIGYRNIHKLEKYIGDKNILLLTLLVPALLITTLIFYSNYLLASIFYVIIAVLIPLRDPILSAQKNKHITSDQRATTISYMSMIYALIAIIIQPIAGYLADINLTYSLYLIVSLLIFAMIFFNINENSLK